MECFAKFRKKKEYSIKWESNLVMEARMSGKLIDKEFYEFILEKVIFQMYYFHYKQCLTI